MARLQLARQAKLMELERARALRLAEDEAEEALEAAERWVGTWLGSWLGSWLAG